MKKWITGALAILLGVASIAIPFSGVHTAEAKTTEKKLNIVTTIFPEYDWTRAVLGDLKEDVELTMLLDNGTDLHSFQPAVKDIMKVSSCDLLIYVGGESDAWIEDALKSAENKDMKTINLMEVLSDTIKEEETVEGMQGSEHGHEHDHEDEDGEEEAEYDEHVWTSLRNASIVCGAIAETLEEMDPENKDVYASNASAYQQKLSDLDAEYQKTVETAKLDTLVFADRFPFRYLVDDYGLNYYAAFSGCSAESEASFKTVTFLAGKIDELGTKNVLTIEKSDDRIAQTVIENTKTKDQNILVLNSMQSITSDEIKEGETYLSVMEDNLGVLKEALN